MPLHTREIRAAKCGPHDLYLGSGLASTTTTSQVTSQTTSRAIHDRLLSGSKTPRNDIRSLIVPGWEWTERQPVDSASLFIPNSTAAAALGTHVLYADPLKSNTLLSAAVGECLT